MLILIISNNSLKIKQKYIFFYLFILIDFCRKVYINFFYRSYFSKNHNKNHHNNRFMILAKEAFLADILRFFIKIYFVKLQYNEVKNF